MCKEKAVHETHSQFLRSVWMQHDLQDIYEGQKSSSESMKLTGSLFEDSNVPKAEVVCSVSTAKTIPSCYVATHTN